MKEKNFNSLLIIAYLISGIFLFYGLLGEYIVYKTDGISQEVNLNETSEIPNWLPTWEKAQQEIADDYVRYKYDIQTGYNPFEQYEKELQEIKDMIQELDVICDCSECGRTDE